MSYTIGEITTVKTWEKFLDRHSPGALFQRFGWGEAQKAANIKVGRYGVYRGDELVGIFQTFDVRAKRGSFLHVRHGPVMGDQLPDAWKTVLNFLLETARRRRMWYIRMNPLIAESTAVLNILRSYGATPAAIHRMDAETCWVLDVTSSEESLLSGMRKSTRYEIRRAKKEGVRVEVTTDVGKLSVFMDLYRQTSSRHGFVPHFGIVEEFRQFAKDNRARLYFGMHGSSIVTSAIIIDCGNQAIYHHGASIPCKHPVSHAVQWRAILDAKARGQKLYNFWGVAPEHAKHHPWHGISVFKRGFGGRQVTYMHAVDIPISPLYVFSRSIDSVRRIMRGYD